MKSKNASIDILKFVFSILIILLHSCQVGNFSLRQNSVYGYGYVFIIFVICRIAVPFFFVTSSYFLFRGMKKSPEPHMRVFNYCKRLFILYSVWFLLNGVYVAVFKLGFPNNMSLKSFIILIRDIILGNGFPASWFLMACIIDAILLFFACKTDKGKNRLAIGIAVFCYIICLLMTYYNFLTGEHLNKIFDLINHYWGTFYISFPFALIFFVIGKIIAEHEESINISVKKALIIFTFLFILTAAEIFLLFYTTTDYMPKSGTTCMMLPLLSASLLILCLKIPLEYKPIYTIFRKTSTIIYCSHGSIMILLNKYISANYDIHSIYKCTILFFSTLLICGVISFIIIKLSQKYNFLKYLY